MAKKTIGIGVIGYGYWGRNIVRNFFHTPGCSMLMVADANPQALQEATSVFPSVKTVSLAGELIESNQIDAVVIATPVSTHYRLTKQALLAGKHVLVEKPVTTSVTEAEELFELAASRGLVILVDHTFLYTSAVQKIRELIGEGMIGNLRYFDSTRINLGLFQADVNVLWDLATHDVAILCYLVKEKALSVNATGISHTGNGIENIAYLSIHYAFDFIAHIHCSWTSPVKIRQTLIGGDRKMIIYNDLEPTEKIRLYDTGFNVNTEDDKRRILVDYRTGDILIPKIEFSEALSSLAANFLGSIQGVEQPLSGPELSLQVVRILEAAQRSIRNRGENVLVA